jgi:DNA-binding transcriptional regulator GbsR (MarR family)
VTLNIRGLVEWHLVRRRPLPGSRRDHYEAATDFFRALQEILERRFRWTVRQVLAAISEARAALEPRGRGATREERERAQALAVRLAALGDFFALIDAGIGMFAEGKPFPAEKLRGVVPLPRREIG